MTPSHIDARKQRRLLAKLINTLLFEECLLVCINVPAPGIEPGSSP